jgi:hypothetical protein
VWVLAGALALAPQTAAAQPARFPNDLRSLDGSGNNTAHLDWGRARTTFLRRTTVAYTDGMDAPAGDDRESARAISNAVAASDRPRPNARGASDFVWQWGQFLDHDLDLSLTNTSDRFDIEVPLGDPQFDPQRTGTQVIPLSRTVSTPVAGVRQQVNAITAYIDASQVYGSDSETALALRTADDTGRLKTSAGNFLPMDANANFVAGDVRVNEQVGLISMQTLFLREHNFWADRIRQDHPELSGDQVYLQARAIVGAEMQAITYNEFLPVLLGRNALRPYPGYRPQVNAGIENAFATAAYRLGHSMLSATLLRLGPNGRAIAPGNIALADAFFNPAAVRQIGIDPYLRGMAAQRAQEIDNQVVDAVRNFLFGAPGAGGFDLASLNIQRGRDHGLPGYDEVRANFGLRRVSSFAQISSSPEVQAKLASVYTSPDDVDLWVGGLAENHVPGAMVGETFFVILRDQFERLRAGDRFWYESYLPPIWCRWCATRRSPGSSGGTRRSGTSCNPMSFWSGRAIDRVRLRRPRNPGPLPWRWERGREGTVCAALSRSAQGRGREARSEDQVNRKSSSGQPRPEPLEVARVVDAAVRIAGRLGLRAGDPVLGQRMVGEELLDLRRAALPRLEELPEQLGRAARVVPGPVGEIDTQAVGFQLGVPAVVRQRAGAQELRQDLLALARIPPQQQAGEQVVAVRARHELRAVARHAMPDLMGHRAGELIQAVRFLDQAAVDVDQAPRQVERVDRRIVDDEEVPGTVPHRSLGGDPPSDLIDVLERRPVVDQPELLLDLRVQVVPHGPLLVQRHQIETGGLGCAGTEQNGQESRSDLHLVEAFVDALCAHAESSSPCADPETSRGRSSRKAREMPDLIY